VTADLQKGIHDHSNGVPGPQVLGGKPPVGGTPSNPPERARFCSYDPAPGRAAQHWPNRSDPGTRPNHEEH
jgi:hypothetical protein